MAARVGQFNTKSPTIKRILREAAELASSPSPDFTATPQEDNLFEWHFTLRGPPGNDTTPSTSSAGPYAEGIYHGRIVLPPTYPLRPPSFRFLTPSGRFETNREICLSISGHHEETWQPAWGLRTALVALRTFMETDAKGQLGGIECNDDQRRRLARESQAWKCSSCSKSNREILKECEEASKELGVQAEAEIPKELKMGFKDEMGLPKPSQTDSDDAESTELAEGFVQTLPITTDAVLTPITPRTTAQISSPATNTGAVALASPVTAAPVVNRFPAPLAVQARVNTQDGVPAWVDKAIIGVVACLIALVTKLLMGR